jgi:uncharacterized lipoprotein YddW (UPF0748 family)
MRRANVRSLAAAGLAALIFLTALFHVVPAARASDEVRALWVVRTSLTSPEAVASMVDTARAAGFNTLLVQVRGRADAYYREGLEPRATPLVDRPDFDPLALVIEQAHAAGLQVHAWINFNLVAGTGELPASSEHIVYRHPEWLMVPQSLAASLVTLDPKGPEYLGRLSRYARSHSDAIEGVYLSPMASGSIAYTVGVIRDIATRYAVDGVHLDYLRYPNEDFDYSRVALEAFRQDVIQDLGAADQRRYDARRADDPLIYTRAFPERWRRFRMSRLTDLLVRIKETVKAARPDLVVSAAVAPDPDEAAERRLQNWRSWLDRDLIDVVCPMAYATDSATFAAQVGAARVAAGTHPLWAGIGAYRLSSAEVIGNVAAARKLGVGGIVLFSYDSLTGPARAPGYLAALGRAAFTNQ